MTSFARTIAAELLLLAFTIASGGVPVVADESNASNVGLIPQPSQVTLLSGSFPLRKQSRQSQDSSDQLYASDDGKWTSIVTDSNAEVRQIGAYLSKRIKETTGVNCPVRDMTSVASGGHFPVDGIRIGIISPGNSNDESYELKIDENAIHILGKSSAGLFRGVQTLLQLSPSARAELPVPVIDQVWQIPCVHIADSPRFRHRGMLLDCGRHFMTKDFVKRYIDLLAYLKMNVLHWHLTEDQGWRIEIKKHPKLTEIGAWRKATRESEQPLDGKGRYGGFYTQDDIREIVAYAQSRYITIIPEIEMPGHSLAALAARPDLSCTGGPFEVGTEWGVIDDVYCAGNDATFELLQDVLTEVIALFPGEYIHIGGDECPKARWKKCAKCQKRIRDEKLKDEHELQSYFIRRIEKFLNAKGRRLIGWDEILEGGLAPNATVQAWRGMDAAATAARAGHDVIVSPTSHCYLDYPQHSPNADPTKAFAVDKVFAFDPMPKGLNAAQQRHILGIEGNIWTERAPQDLVDSRVFPRLCAIAEIGWSPADSRDWNEFRGRLRAHLPRLDALGVKYFIDPPRFASGASPFTGHTDVVLESPVMEGQILYTLDGSVPNGRSPRYHRPLRLTKTTVVQMRLLLDDSRVSEVVSRMFRRQDDPDTP